MQCQHLALMWLVLLDVCVWHYGGRAIRAVSFWRFSASGWYGTAVFPCRLCVLRVAGKRSWGCAMPRPLERHRARPGRAARGWFERAELTRIWRCQTMRRRFSASFHKRVWHPFSGAIQHSLIFSVTSTIGAGTPFISPSKTP